MQEAVPSSRIFKFGLFEADVARATLTRNGVRVKIQDQPFRVLVLLLERPNELVTREEIKQKLWPEGTFVDFDGSLNVIMKKLRAAIDDDSDNPRFIETVPRRGYRFIAPVSLGAKPSNLASISKIESPGFPSGAPSVATPGLGPVSLPVLGRAPRPKLYATSGLLILIAFTAWLMLRGAHSASESFHPRTISTVPMRKSIAVLGFHNLSGNSEDAWLGTALSEMLSTELAGGEQLRLVSGEEIANLRIASPWSQTDSLDQVTTSRIGAALSSDLLVLGSYTTIHMTRHAQLRLDVRMQDARTGEILTEFAESGGTEELFRMIFNVGSRLRNRLGVPDIKEGDQAGILAALPLNPDAARFYALGILKLRQFDALAAKDLLLQATEADPKFCLGHAMLARAWGQLGYDQKRRLEAKRALDLSADLPRTDKMLVEGEYYDGIGNHEQAATVYDALFQLFPDNVDYGLRFATALIKVGNSKKALSVIAQLRTLPPPSSADPRIDLTESAAIKVNKPASLALVRSAVKKASAQGKTPIYALARRDECLALLYSDQPEGVFPTCEDAYNVFLSAGNRAGAADAVRLIADRQGSEGHYAEAIATYERALSLLDGLGEYGRTGAILNNMAINFANQGKLDLAQKYYQEAKTDFEMVGEKVNSATANTNIADILYLRGNLSAAEKGYRRSLELLATADHAENGYELYRLADLELTRGNIKDAKIHAQQAVDAYRSSEGSFQYLTGAMVVLGEIMETEADFTGATAQFAQTITIRQKMGELDLVAESQVELANLSIEEGHPERAIPLLQNAIIVFEKEKADPDASNAYTKLSRAQLLTGKLNDAHNSIDHALKLSQTNSDPALRLEASIQKAEVDCASGSAGDVSAAQQELRSVRAEAHRLGYYPLEYEARFTLAKIQLRTNVSAANALLSALASEARSHGFLLIAQRAEEMLAGPGNVLANNKVLR
jgi:DNA-binding winged helix-turn-helix (wHTH) protein/tetratricopeptide (TPR) repeat protein/TolB-like protein